MADKDDLSVVPEESEDNLNKDAELTADEQHEALKEHEALGLDLSTDPEFLALAAEFDATIKNREAKIQEPDATAVFDPEPEGLPDEFVAIYTGEPEGESELEAAENDGSAFSAESVASANFEPDFVLLESEAAPESEPEEEAAFDERAEEEAGGQEYLMGPEHSEANLLFKAGASVELGDPDEQDFTPEYEAERAEDSACAAEDYEIATEPMADVNIEATHEESDSAAGQPDNAAKAGQAEDLDTKAGFLRFGCKNSMKPAGENSAGKKESKNRRAADKPQVLPRLAALPEANPTILSRVFDSLALAGLFILTAIFLVQVVPGLQTNRLLWFSDELRQAEVLRGIFDGKWLQVYLNGEIYQEAPPLYFWFLAGLHGLLALVGLDLGADYAKLLYIGSAVSGLMFLWATLGLARSTARLDRRGVFATGCVLLSVLFLQFFFHYSSLDLFFAAFIIASHIFLFKALMLNYAPLQMALAFLCAAIALMSKGALGLALPVCSAVLFVVWRGKPQRLFKPDFLLGLFFALLPLLIWLGSIWATGQHDVVIQMLKEQVWIKAFGDAWHSEPWWWYLAVLPAMWLPWSFLLLVRPWHQLFSRKNWEAIKSACSGERQGLAFVWISFIGAFVLISVISSKQPVYLIPLMGPLAVLTGRGVLLLSPARSMILQRLLAVMFFILAVFFVIIPVYYSGDIPSFFSWLEYLKLPEWEVRINGIFLLAVVMLIATCLLIGVIKARRPESTLLVMLLCATLFSYPLSTMSMPSLDEVVSSRAASIEIRRYERMGYYTVSFKVYSGVFSYYSGLVINETGDWNELDRMVAEHPKVIVAMGANRWKDWTHNPGFTEIMRFWMLSHEYVLLLRNTATDGSNLQEDVQSLNDEAEQGPENGVPGETGQESPVPVATKPEQQPVPEVPEVNAATPPSDALASESAASAGESAAPGSSGTAGQPVPVPDGLVDEPELELEAPYDPADEVLPAEDPALEGDEPEPAGDSKSGLEVTDEPTSGQPLEAEPNLTTEPAAPEKAPAMAEEPDTPEQTGQQPAQNKLEVQTAMEPEILDAEVEATTNLVEEPIPAGLPMTDDPQPYDPFSPVSPE